MVAPWLTLSCTVANTGKSCFSVRKKRITVAIIDQIELSNDEFDLQFDTREGYGSEDVPDIKEIIDKAEEIIRRFDEGAGKDDFYSVSCYPTITTRVWNGDEYVIHKNIVENFYYDKGVMLDMGEGFDVELAELTDIEQLNICQIIIDAAKDNGIEL